MTRPRYPHGVPCWLELVGADIAAATSFYGAVFGWEVDDGVARLDGRAVAGLGAAAATGHAPAGPARWATSIAVDDVDVAAAAVAAHGGTVRHGPVDVGDVARVAACTDPAGAGFGLWDAAGRIGAELVNAPGTWNWSDLATGDPDGAATFYGAVFGWRAVPLPAFGATMWQLPGYADHLDSLDPERAERHAADGVPPGFGDAIGWLVTAPDDDPPAWVVTFAVAATDAAVDRVVAAGGTVVDPPHDLGPTRLAVVEDPFGARFTVSHYRPG
ncbi:MAG TPA: VOC family protein [Iamia sp.]|jgi:predicted enzyme related to lactoylglutathione lyase|nr:VOC family protein [Iamia sp.]